MTPAQRLLNNSYIMKFNLPIASLSLAISLTAASLSSCSDDKNTVSPVGDKLYAQNAGLELFYSQAPMPGKFAMFSQSGQMATITLGSEIDLSQIAGLGLSGKLKAPGVLPGSETLVLQNQLLPNGDFYNFSGKGETDYVTYAYAGKVNKDSLVLAFDGVKLKNTRLAETAWVPAPIQRDDKGLGYKSFPFHLVWEYEPLPEVTINFEDILYLVAGAPIIPVYNNTAYSSIAQLLGGMVKSVGFRSDGNIVTTYLGTSNGSAQYMQTPLNGMQYVVVSDNIMKLYPNPLSLYSLILTLQPAGSDDPNISFTRAEGDAKPSVDLKKLLAAVIDAVGPTLATGVPAQYSLSQSGLDIFINTEMAVTLLNKIMLPLLQDDATLKAIIDYASSQPELAQLLPELQKALPLIPKLFERTNRLEIGLSYLPYPAK